MGNLKTRLISSAVFGAVMLSAMLLNRYVFAVVFLSIMLLTMMEFCHITVGKGSHTLPCALMLLAGAVLFAAEFLSRGFGLDGGRLLCLAIVPFAASMCSFLTARERPSFVDFAYLCTSLVYVAIPISLSNVLVFDADGEFSGLTLLGFFITVWSSDIGAYIFGMGFGQKPDSRKLCPDISPKKSWWGFWGGLLFTVLAVFGIRAAGILDIPSFHCVGLGLVMGVGAVLGDLFESMWKRSFSLKDSGSIIPGHGGILDRFDSSLLAMPAGAVYLTIFGLI